jgi:flagellar protein FliS
LIKENKGVVLMAMLNPYNYKKPVGVVAKAVVKKPIVNKPAVNNAYAKKTTDYLEQRIMAAKPEELTLMLFDGAIKFITQAKLFNDQKNIEKSSNANLRAQAIIEELRSTLDMEIDISKGLEDLYIFMNDRLVDANVSKDNNVLEEVLELITDLRDTWKTAMKL